MELSRLQALAGLTESKAPVKLSEGKGQEYGDSSEFEDAASNLQSLLTKSKAILTSPAWKAWMVSTDSNYGTKATVKNTDLIGRLALVQKGYDELYYTLEKAA